MSDFSEYAFVDTGEPAYRYACCEHCEHDDHTDFPVDGHTVPCDHGCNDGEGAA